MYYRHTVHYYETDKMGITHHSNYIRWLEEARVWYMAKAGCGYDVMESEGIMSPVLSVQCSYKKSTAFADVIEIRLRVKEFKGVRLVLEYELYNTADGSLVCTAESGHCFLDKSGKPMNLKRARPDCFDRLMTLAEIEKI